MNLKELKAEVRINLNDFNFAEETDDTLRLLINRGIRKVEKELLKNGIYLKKRIITLSFVSGVQEVDITNSFDITRIIVLQDEDGNIFDIAEEEVAKRSQQPCYYISRQVTITGVPLGDNQRNDQLGYYQIPTSNWDINLVVNDRFNEFKFGDTLKILTDIPENHHDLLVTWATIQYLFKDEEPSDYWMSQWNDQINDLIMSVAIENRNYQTVIDTYGD